MTNSDYNIPTLISLQTLVEKATDNRYLDFEKKAIYSLINTVTNSAYNGNTEYIFYSNSNDRHCSETPEFKKKFLEKYPNIDIPLVLTSAEGCHAEFNWRNPQYKLSYEEKHY